MSNNEQNSGLAMVLALFTGFIAGTAIGLLYAPYSGEETRAKVRKTSADVKNQTVEFAQQTMGAIKEGVQTLDPRQDTETAGEGEKTEAT